MKITQEQIAELEKVIEGSDLLVDRYSHLVWVSVKQKLPKAKTSVWLKNKETEDPKLGKLHRSKSNALIYGVTAPFWEFVEWHDFWNEKVFKDKDFFTHWAEIISTTRMKQL